MNECVCLDSSVLVKVFVEEEESGKASGLIRQIIERKQLIVLPAFACLEIGSVLCKKQRRGDLSPQDAENVWLKFRHFKGVAYLENEALLDLAWTIRRNSGLPTIYDAVFLAASEWVTAKTGAICEFWTADERLVNLLNGHKDYVRLLRDWAHEPLSEPGNSPQNEPC